jgi:mannose-6-phosphate isomerase
MDTDLLPLKGVVQNYAWGGKQYIPHLLGQDNRSNIPHAELWIGAHPSGPSHTLLDNRVMGLDRLIARDPQAILGKRVIDRFGPTLPYLFKVLDAAKMLSIQVHPSKKQAREGYKRENDKGIPVSAPSRNYRDSNHKPEVHVALTDFWMLHGFRPEKESNVILNSIPEFSGLAKIAATHGIETLYRQLMDLPLDKVTKILSPLFNRLSAQHEKIPLDPDTPEYWALQAFKQYGTTDHGIFSIFLFNLLHLKPGQGTFQAAGVPHAYLRGTTMELMANSDNVLRGGLTPKHVDVPELLDTLKFDFLLPSILTGTSTNPAERIYPVPVQDFQLSALYVSSLLPFESSTPHGPDALILVDGAVHIRTHKRKIHGKQGDIWMVPADQPYEITSSESATLYRATVSI